MNAIPLQNEEIHQLARNAKYYDGTRKSFEKEIESRPYKDTQLGLFHTELKRQDIQMISYLTNRISKVMSTEADTSMKKHYNQLIYALTHTYGYLAVKCPMCATPGIYKINRNPKVECLNCTYEADLIHLPSLFI